MVKHLQVDIVLEEKEFKINTLQVSFTFHFQQIYVAKSYRFLFFILIPQEIQCPHMSDSETNDMCQANAEFELSIAI